MNTSEKTKEARTRRQLKRQGFALEKRTNKVDPYHSGCYRILNAHAGTIEAGSNFDMTLEEVETFARE